MRYFVCLLDFEGHGIDDGELRRYESLPRSRGLEFKWHAFPHVAALTAWDKEDAEPLVTGEGDHVAAGVVRLDNRPDFDKWVGAHRQTGSDLQLVLRDTVRYGPNHVHLYLGDFGFVACDAVRRTAVAACDAFALRKVYYTQQGRRITFASRAEALALDDGYEPQYLAELIANCIPSPGLSVYSGVRAIPNGCMAIVQHGRLSLHQHWSATAFEPQPIWRKSEPDAAERCRQLLCESVRLRLAGNGATWGQLSGGMDSSSVASVAQWLTERGDTPYGLAGTVTYVDRRGTESDERLYSDTVVKRWQLRNEQIVEPPIWNDERHPPPRTDQPRMDYPFYRREQELCAIVRAAGGRVVLTGIGGDELFTGFMYFFADWLARGHPLAAIREMAHRAALGRGSFWTLAYENGLLPLLPSFLRKRLVRAGGHVPAWMPAGLARHHRLHDRTFSAAFYAGPVGRKYQHGVLTSMVGLGRLIEPGIVGDELELRHPFLYRPLVEFALQLPPELCARPHQRKWVLREAMRGILPDAIRTRVGKGSPAELYAWSLATLRQLLEPLVRQPILADLGVVDAHRLRAAFQAAPHEPHNVDHRHTMLYTTLTTEAWLQVRSSRWPCGGSSK